MRLYLLPLLLFPITVFSQATHKAQVYRNDTLPSGQKNTPKDSVLLIAGMVLLKGIDLNAHQLKEVHSAETKIINDMVPLQKQLDNISHSIAMDEYLNDSASIRADVRKYKDLAYAMNLQAETSIMKAAQNILTFSQFRKFEANIDTLKLHNVWAPERLTKDSGSTIH